MKGFISTRGEENKQQRTNNEALLVPQNKSSHGRTQSEKEIKNTRYPKLTQVARGVENGSFLVEKGKPLGHIGNKEAFTNGLKKMKNT